MHIVEKIRTELSRIGVADIVRVVDCSADGRYVYMIEEQETSYGYGHPADALLDAFTKVPDGALLARPGIEPTKHIWASDDETRIVHVRGDLYQTAIKGVPKFGYNMNVGADDMETPEVDWIIGGHPGDHKAGGAWDDIWRAETDPALTLPDDGGPSGAMGLG